MTITLGSFVASQRARELVNQVLDSGRLSYGPLSRQFEQEFSAIHGCHHGVLSNSGTSSLQVALLALKERYSWPDGAEVIVPAVTFVATVNAVLHSGLRPVLADVDQQSYNVNPDCIERSITPHTVAIMPVHLCGLPCDMLSIMSIAGQHGLAVVEDCCEAAFASYRDRPVGSWGDIGVFSFYVAHHLVTGVGGMAITNDEDLAHSMRSLVNHGLDLDELPNGDEYDPAFLGRHFRFRTPGHSYRITELEAALGLAGLETWERDLYVRRRNARLLGQLLGDLYKVIHTPGYLFHHEKPSWMMFPLVLTQDNNHHLIKHLNQNNIEARELLPLVQQPAFSGLWEPSDYPIALWLEGAGLYVGCHQGLGTLDMQRISNVIHGFF